ncbi:DedA family protein [Alphaproteobacteria bacterium]|nr:DedA family protein [Alphaproteobacteria bacterium]
MKLLRKLYEWTLAKAAHKNASWFLSIVSFTESSFFPIPPDIILIPMIIAKKTKAFFYAFICTISSLFGGVAGYCIGYFFYNSIGFIIIGHYGLSDQFTNFEQYYNDLGVWIVLGAGFTPFPFKFITIASGVFELNFFLFICVSFISRGARFYLIAMLLKIFGDKIKLLIEKYFNLLASLFFILLIGGIVLLKFL